MPAASTLVGRVYSTLDTAAIACAIMLSVSCLLRGAVYDSVIALLLLACVPILLVASTSRRPLHAALTTTGIACFSGFLVILCLQWLLPAGGDAGHLWQQVQALTGADVTPTMLHDKAAWLQSLGRLLFFTIVFIIALFVGSSESSARLFLQALLISGTVCLALTFFVATSDGIPSSTHYSYTHGFVNPNSASSYLGIMLLLAMAQAVRFFKFPGKTFEKLVLDIIDQLNVGTISNACFLLFSVLLALAGLFMTGSRAGVFLALLSCACFAFLVMKKLNLRTRLRKAVLLVFASAMIGVLIWSFTNFGQVTMAKIQTNGASANSRFDIFAAVLPMIGDHPWLGTGLGSFPSAFQPYRPATISSDGIIDKAHNSYLEFAAEMGIPALLILLTGFARIGYLLWSSIKTRSERYVVPAFGFALLVLVGLHSLIDFPLQIPGIAALFIALITVCVSQTDPRFCQPAELAAPPVKRRRIRKRRNPVAAT